MPLSGTLLLAYADRWPPRAVLVGYDLIRAVVAAVLAAGLLSPTAMLALVFVTGIPSAVASAARSALLPELLAVVSLWRVLTPPRAGHADKRPCSCHIGDKAVTTPPRPS